MIDKLKILFMAAMATVLIASCGGDDSVRTVTTRPEAGLPLDSTSRSKADYLARANRFCRLGVASIRKHSDDYFRDRGPNTSDSQLFAYTMRNAVLPQLQFWFDDISYIGAPKGEKAQTEAMLEALQLAVFSGEERRIVNERLLSAVFGSFNRLAREYGLDDCLVDEQLLKPISVS